jgi:Tetratricopeptide repeat
MQFKSYRSSRDSSDLLQKIKIWEAVRETSAVSSFFDSTKIDNFGEEFISGGTGADNPVQTLWVEAKHSLLKPGESIEGNLKCSVSIGAGVPSIKPFRDNLLEIAKPLGSEDMSTLVIVNNLGTLYNTQGKLAKAEQMYLQVLKDYEKMLGREHTSTLAIVNNLGALYTTQGRLTKSEQMYQRALSGYEKGLGREHTSTLAIVNNLGALTRCSAVSIHQRLPLSTTWALCILLKASWLRQSRCISEH